MSQTWSEMSQWLVRKHPVLSPQTRLGKSWCLVKSSHQKYPHVLPQSQQGNIQTSHQKKGFCRTQKQQEMSEHQVKNTQFCCYNLSCKYPDVFSKISRVVDTNTARKCLAKNTRHLPTCQLSAAIFIRPHPARQPLDPLHHPLPQDCSLHCPPPPPPPPEPSTSRSSGCHHSSC